MRGLRHRRSGVLLVATGLLCLGASALPLFPATAEEDEPGSGLGSFSLAANAPSMQVRVAYPEQQCSAQPSGVGACEGVLNETVSTLRNGPVGYALSSVGWPGTLGGNLGTLLIVAGGAPPESTVLNSPVRAENNISGREDTVTNDTVPGAYMSATATEDKVEAKAVIGAAQATPLGTLGQITSTTRTATTGVRTAEAVAHSEVQNIVLGPLVIQSVVSDAKATTDGVNAVPSGRTTVTGASVGGVPVTFDERGVSVAGTTVPGLGDATKAVNDALSQAGMTVAVSSPTGKPDGASVQYTSGALSIVWQADPKTTFTILIGGATVAVRSTPGFDFDLGGTPIDPGTSFPGTTPVDTTVPPALSGSTGGVPDLGTGPVPPTTAGTDPKTSVVASSSRALPDGLSPWYGVLAVLGAGLFMAGLRRLPDRVLAVPATACPQGETA